MLNQFLSGQGGVDPSQLAGAAGLPADPAALAAMLSQLQNAMSGAANGEVNWSVADEQARKLANTGSVETTPEVRAQLEQALNIAALWLADATQLSALSATPSLVSRAEWSRLSMPVWTQLAEPVATSISDALGRVLAEQAPEEMRGMIENASQMLRSVGGALFALQLGQVVGQLSTEVVSGGDIGIPLMEDNHAVLIPQNIAAFGEGLDIPVDQIQIYLAVRELAHARLFRNARWLRLHLISSITAFARGINIDTERMESLAEDFDPSNPEQLREALSNGSLIPPKSEEQLATLARLETTLALIEGWVDVVTTRATTRLPRAQALSETVKRRRATGGPAESAFSTLVGLELRPRRLREAAAMWQTVTDAVGDEARDALWSHPDLVPTSADIDDPAALVARLEAAARGEAPARDEMDDALEALLRGEAGGSAEDPEDNR
ncbi:zinc-dependent metalloprotease [Mycetocola spongiae]|nr:zinc-dependent metalloprotease [Mycetocola spongiae]UCR90655.1 zinc-dependent metalloprotease [Mycetocola spongiae]